MFPFSEMYFEEKPQEEEAIEINTNMKESIKGVEDVLPINDPYFEENINDHKYRCFYSLFALKLRRIASNKYGYVPFEWREEYKQLPPPPPQKQAKGKGLSPAAI